jgi:adenylylsulfate kinase
MKSSIKNWQKKTAVYIGRFQPIHDGHFEIIKKAIKKNGQIVILVMDSYKINKKNPFTFNQVKKKIQKKLINFVGKYEIIKIPVVSEFIYGRKVGYKINRYKIGSKLEKISATKIRKGLNIG